MQLGSVPPGPVPQHPLAQALFDVVIPQGRVGRLDRSLSLSRLDLGVVCGLHSLYDTSGMSRTRQSCKVPHSFEEALVEIGDLQERESCAWNHALYIQ